MHKYSGVLNTRVSQNKYLSERLKANTSIKTKFAYVVFSTPEGDLHFKVIRAETYIKDNGKWYFVLCKGTNFLTQEEFDQYKKAHTTKN